jgi:hypothetical protein
MVASSDLGTFTYRSTRAQASCELSTCGRWNGWSKVLRSWLRIALKLVCETRLESDSVDLPAELDAIEELTQQPAKRSSGRMY